MLASADGDADGAAGRLLHRLPRVGPRARRADHRGRRTAARPRPRRRSTRSPSAVRRHLAAWPSASRSTSPTAWCAGPGSGSAASPRRRSGRSPPRPPSRAGRGTSETVEAAARGAGRRGHADRRPAGQRASSAPRCSARRCASCSLRARDGASALLDRRTAVMSHLSRPPRRTPSSAQPCRTRARPCTSPATRSTPTTSSAAASDVLHAHPVQAPHAHARITRLDPARRTTSPASSGC